MKGIILAGGSGTRLYPITKSISKQLMPIYDKPMIYYPISLLLQAGIREILIITTPKDKNSFENLLGDGKNLGCRFEYISQPAPDGLPQAFILGEKFIGGDKVCLALGDNIFYGSNLNQILEESIDPKGGIVFACHVHDPQRYGVVEFDKNLRATGVEEKPENPKSNYAICGIYFYDNSVIEVAKNTRPSLRGELEITDIISHYLDLNKLQVKVMDSGTTWLDTGTFASMNRASQFVQLIEERQGLKIGCIEEVAFSKGFINRNQLHSLAKPLIKSGYGEYLLNLTN